MRVLILWSGLFVDEEVQEEVQEIELREAATGGMMALFGGFFSWSVEDVTHRLSHRRSSEK